MTHTGRYTADQNAQSGIFLCPERYKAPVETGQIATRPALNSRIL